MQKRPLVAKAVKWLARGRAPRPRSSALAKRIAIYRPRAAAFLVANPTCAWTGCAKASDDVHHTRGRIGRLLLEERWWKPACRGHHDRCKTEPVAARAAGMLCDEGKWNTFEP